MRPIRLTMQAFGPFAGREVVDFREAIESGLFGIYGPTGSGKSTIFSAMTFALFGEGTKDELETSSFRSHHADDDLPSEIEFVFGIGAQQFVIRRRPEQLRPKKTGTGATKDSHEAWLFDATGIPVDEITERNPGKVIAEKKVNSVRDAVTVRLGYGPEQFRQIVLLPQGKFETFLTAKTDKRLEILRELFDVSLYQRMAAKLRENAKAAEAESRQAREICARQIAMEGFADGPALEAGIAAAGQHLAGEQEKEQTARQAVASQEQVLAAALELDRAFADAETANAVLAAVEGRSAEMEVLRAQVGNARLAVSLADIESHLSEAVRDVASAGERQQQAAAQDSRARDAAQQAAEHLAAERVRAEGILDLQRKGDELVRHRETMDRAEALKAAALNASADESRAKTAFARADAECRSLAEQAKKLEALRTKARDSEADRARLMQDIAVAQAGLAAARTQEAAVSAVALASAKLAGLEAAQDKARVQLASAETRFAEAEIALSGVQALHLAAKLDPGAPCPVCGSLAHPAPANGTIENSGVERSFREAKLALDQAQSAAAAAATACVSARATWQERSANLAGLAVPVQTSRAFGDGLALLNSRLSALGAAQDIGELDTRISRLADHVEAKAGEAEHLRAAREQATTRAALANQMVAQSLESIPPDLHRAEMLATAIADNLRSRRVREEALKQAEAADQQARAGALGAQKDVEAAQNTHAEAFRRHERALSTFEARLAQNGLTRPMYETYKAHAGTIASDEARIRAHADQLAAARSTAESAAQAIEDRARPDLPALNLAVDLARQELEAVQRALAHAGAHLAKLEKLHAAISQELKRLAQFDLETQPLRDLAAMFNADNPLRLDLETYAIGAIFDQVLIAANQRLQPMSGGRFALEREATEGKGGARRGLGIRIHDIHTGRPRATATLSGGETFIAALALALGLSDIVESTSGNIRLDTIFIDEGFGSLDTENDAGTLDMVLQTLTHLVSQNRAVGLISHVPLVQQAIPNGFYIRKTQGGSHVEPRALV